MLVRERMEEKKEKKTKNTHVYLCAQTLIKGKAKRVQYQEGWGGGGGGG